VTRIGGENHWEASKREISWQERKGTHYALLRVGGVSSLQKRLGLVVYLGAGAFESKRAGTVEFQEKVSLSGA